MKVLWYCHECGKRHVLNHVFVGGWYRLAMRLLHRSDLCWMQPVPVEPGFAWCQWCGMRGRR